MHDLAQLETKLDQLLAQKAVGVSRTVPWATSGSVRDSEPFSFVRALGYTRRVHDREKAKVEADFSDRLRKVYQEKGFGFDPNAVILPMSSSRMSWDLQEADHKLVTEYRQMEKSWGPVDPDEVDYLRFRMGMREKAPLSTIQETTGGALQPFPLLGEVIDIQRNLEVFANAGAMEVTLPPQNRLNLPKLTAPSVSTPTAQGATIASSAESFGTLKLEGKKIPVLIVANGEVFRFTNASTESIIRTDMARVAALRMDKDQLEGTGGVQILGLINHVNDPNDPVQLYVQTSGAGLGANGNTFQWADVANMEGLLPDVVQDGWSWVMRRDMAAKLFNRRADQLSAGDQAGLPLFLLSRGEIQSGPWRNLFGGKLIRSRQVSNTRVKGTGGNLTYILMGYFPDWVTARLGVAEVIMTNVGVVGGVSAVENDQIILRLIQFADAGPRHGQSFIFTDTLLVA